MCYLDRLRSLSYITQYYYLHEQVVPIVESVVIIFSQQCCHLSHECIDGQYGFRRVEILTFATLTEVDERLQLK
jgi:hypothetical protein